MFIKEGDFENDWSLHNFNVNFPVQSGQTERQASAFTEVVGVVFSLA